MHAGIKRERADFWLMQAGTGLICMSVSFWLNGLKIGLFCNITINKIL